ncbi:MAG: VWA domain-containing protein [Polyangiaceae bacterium]|nr:VWA domain-containing protein [Polyangiaceae bacterium]
MRSYSRSSIALFAFAFVAGTVGLIACSADSSHDGAWDGEGSGGSNNSGNVSGSSSSGWNGGGSGGGGFQGTGSGAGEPPPPPPPPDGPPDAGADAGQVTCDELDQTKPVILYLSADDSNSMASPAHVRELIGLGVSPYPTEVRTYEFLNYYNVAYPAPEVGKLALFPELDATAVPGEFDFQIGVRSFDAVKPRRPMTITFVLDTSGSMGGPGIERERAAVKAIAQSLTEGDIVNMVTWNTSNNIVLDGRVVTGPNDAQVLAQANALEASGGTDLHSGLVKGYQLAEKHYGSTRLNRVILISDGGANVGVTSSDLIGLKSQDADKEGIYLVGIGAGSALSYSDQLMDVVTDKGRGAYVYLDNLGEATHMFVDRFDEVMEVAARGVQIELTMPWYFQMHKFYGEEYSGDPKEIEPQHLAPSDAMIFNQVLKACSPSIIEPTDTITVRAKWKTPLAYLDQQTEVTMTVGDLLSAQKAGLPKAKAIVAYAEALKAPSKQAFDDALALIKAADPASTDAALKEIASLIAAHPNNK